MSIQTAIICTNGYGIKIKEIHFDTQILILNECFFVQFDVYDWDSDGSHDYIGGFTATLEEMLQASQHEVGSNAAATVLVAHL